MILKARRVGLSLQALVVLGLALASTTTALIKPDSVQTSSIVKRNFEVSEQSTVLAVDDGDLLKGYPSQANALVKRAAGDNILLQQMPLAEEKKGIQTPWNSFSLAFLMILFSEIGDKTFLIAALMAMKHSRMLVFSAALASLVVMTVLSALLGHMVPTLLPKRFTSFAAAILFFVFGAKMFREGFEMDPNAGVEEELEEVAHEIEEESGMGKAIDMEAGRMSEKARSRAAASPLHDTLAGIRNLMSLVFSPAWVQTFVMTFLGEWGDRSQIATIAMAAGQGYTWVIVGAIVGHGVCTGGAVVGGRMIATKISVRNITLGGAACFVVFGFLYLYEAIYWVPEVQY